MTSSEDRGLRFESSWVRTWRRYISQQRVEKGGYDDKPSTVVVIHSTSYLLAQTLVDRETMVAPVLHDFPKQIPRFSTIWIDVDCEKEMLLEPSLTKALDTCRILVVLAQSHEARGSSPRRAAGDSSSAWRNLNGQSVSSMVVGQPSFRDYTICVSLVNR